MIDSSFVTIFLTPLFAVVYALLPAPAVAQWWNPLAPKTYDECILKNMKGVTSDRAADAVTVSCMNEFGSPHERELLPAYVNGECNFTWTGGRFAPEAQQPNNGFKQYRVTYGHSMKFSVWISNSLDNSWGKDHEREFNALIGSHTDHLVNQCDKMMSYAGRR